MLAAALTSLGRGSEASALEEENARYRARFLTEHKRLMRLPSSDIDALRYRQDRAQSLWVNFQRELAIELFEENLAEARRLRGPLDAETSGFRETLLRAYRQCPPWELYQARALPHYDEKASTYEEVFGVGHPATLEVQDWIKEAEKARAAIQASDVSLGDGAKYLRSQLRSAAMRQARQRDQWNQKEQGFLSSRSLLFPDEPREVEPAQGRPLPHWGGGFMLDSLKPMWHQIKSAHPEAIGLPERGPLPRQGFNTEGCLYVVQWEQICAVLAPSLQEAWRHLLKSDPSGQRLEAVWVRGPASETVQASPILSFDHGRNPLRVGRPISITQPEGFLDAPSVGGIYRIHRVGADGKPEIYVGRSSNLRRRPGRHEKTAGRSWSHEPGGVARVELLPAKPPETSSAWTAVDLDEAEAQHIEQARTREAKGGPRVLNITVGRNGPASVPGPRQFIWRPEPIVRG